MANLSHAVSIGQEDKLLDHTISPLVQVIDDVARVDSRLIARECKTWKRWAPHVCFLLVLRRGVKWIV